MDQSITWIYVTGILILAIAAWISSSFANALLTVGWGVLFLWACNVFIKIVQWLDIDEDEV